MKVHNSDESLIEMYHLGEKFFKMMNINNELGIVLNFAKITVLNGWKT